MNGINFRNITAKDINDVADLWVDLTEFHRRCDGHFTMRKRARNDFTDYLTSTLVKTDVLVLVAEYQSHSIGFCHGGLAEYAPLMVQTTYGTIWDIIVREEFRRHGIGTHLILQMKAWFKKKGLARLEVSSVLANPISMSFWRKQGFKPYVEKMYLEPESG
jgi:GNAT superfamily N-acetyltransferase